jgi:hypothetical protein
MTKTYIAVITQQCQIYSSQSVHLHEANLLHHLTELEVLLPPSLFEAIECLEE